MYVCLLSSKTDLHIQCCKIKMNYTFNIIFLNQKKSISSIYIISQWMTCCIQSLIVPCLKRHLENKSFFFLTKKESSKPLKAICHICKGTVLQVFCTWLELACRLFVYHPKEPICIIYMYPTCGWWTTCLPGKLWIQPGTFVENSIMSRMSEDWRPEQDAPGFVFNSTQDMGTRPRQKSSKEHASTHWFWAVCSQTPKLWASEKPVCPKPSRICVWNKATSASWLQAL